MLDLERQNTYLYYMRYLIIVLAFFSILSLAAQTKPSFGLEFGVGYLQSQSTTVTEQQVNGTGFGTELNLLVSKSVAQHFSVTTGIGGQLMTINQDINHLVFGCDIATSIGGSGGPTTITRAIFQLAYVQVPISVTYHFSEGHRGFYTRGGANLLFNVKNDFSTEFLECGQGDWRDYPTSNQFDVPLVVMPKISFGYELRKGNSSSVYLEAYFATSISNLTEEGESLPTGFPVPAGIGNTFSFGIKSGWQLR